MAVSPELIADWQRQLKLHEAAGERGNGRAAWLRRTYRRLFHFLLAAYSDGWRSDVTEAKSVTDISTDSLIHEATTVSLAGKPAKTIEEMRGVLGAIHKEIPPIDGGALMNGLAKDAWMVVASSNSNLNVMRCSWLFGNHAIPNRIVRRGTQLYAEVPHEKFEVARQLVKQNRSMLRRLRKPHAMVLSLFAVVGFTLAGALCGMLFSYLVLMALGLETTLNGSSIKVALTWAGMICGVALALWRIASKRRAIARLCARASRFQ